MFLGDRGWLYDRRLLLAAAETTKALKQEVNQSTDAMGHVYNGTSDAEHAVLVSMAEGKVTPVAALDRLFASLLQLEAIHSVEPGPLGGEARCGKGRVLTFEATVCAWADSASIGVVSFLSSDERGRDRTGDFVTARGQLEQLIP